MEFAPLTTVEAQTQLEAQRMARFEALRQRVFGEMSQAHVRMKLALIAPFHALVLAILAFRGYPAPRLALQTVIFLTWSALFAVQASNASSSMYSSGVARRSSRYLYANLGLFALAIGNTGGLMSPLVPMVLTMMAGVSVGLPNRAGRMQFFGVVSLVFASLAILAHTAVGTLMAPLAPRDGMPSPEYVIIAFGALALSTLHISQFGTFVKSAYERIGFELAARREELCTEGADRTRALEGVAARLAHEVKNPLAAIKGLSAHMASQATDPKMAERLSIVAAEADRLRGIVDGFLSFSRGLDELSVSKAKPYELARELSLLLETRAADAQLTLEVTGSVDAALNADVRKLRQVLLNLVLNAMQASPPGETVTMHVGEKCDADGFLRIQVRDHGAGMSPEVLERIRKPYFTTKEGGTGLGVAVARGLIEQHGGHISYESSPGTGTTVSIDLPRCALSSPLAQKQLPKPPRSPCGAPVERSAERASPSTVDVSVDVHAGVPVAATSEASVVSS
jgi:signal transduction histidine kinase